MRTVIARASSLKCTAWVRPVESTRPSAFECAAQDRVPGVEHLFGFRVRAGRYRGAIDDEEVTR
jgi:hypothetical protein